MDNPDYLLKIGEVLSLTGLSEDEVKRTTTDDLLNAENRFGKVLAEKLYAVMWEMPESFHYMADPSTRILALALALKDHHPDETPEEVKLRLLQWYWGDMEPNPSMEWMVRNYPAIITIAGEYPHNFMGLGKYEAKEMFAALYARGEDVSMARAVRARDLRRKIMNPLDYAGTVPMPRLLHTLDVGDECGDDDVAMYAMLRWTPAETRGYALKSLTEMRDGGVPVKAAFDILSAARDGGNPSIPNLIAGWNAAADAGLPMELVETLFGLEKGSWQSWLRPRDIPTVQMMMAYQHLRGRAS